MAVFDQNLIIGLLVLAVAVAAVYTFAPNLFRGLMPTSGAREFFANKKVEKMAGTKAPVAPAVAKPVPKAATTTESFSDYQGGSDSMGTVPMNAAKKPAGCYPREQLNPTDLLPHDVNSAWAQVNPQGAGDIQGKNFLSAGALVGVNTIGQSLRNANYQLRAEPPNPQVQVGPWMQTTIEPDLQRRPLE